MASSPMTRAAHALEHLLRPRTGGDPSSARVILVLEYQLALGYCVHMTPVFEALKRNDPDRIVIVATRGLSLEVLRHNPFVDHLLDTPDPLHDLPTAIASLRQQLRGRNLKPEGTLTGTADQRTRIGLLALASSPGWRGGFSVHDALYQYPLRYDPGLSRMANNLRVAALVGSDTACLEPQVFYSPTDVAHTRTLLGPFAGRPVLAIIPGNSGGLPTAWHDERWAQVIDFAQRQLGYEVVFVGGQRDIPRIERIRELAGGIGTSLAGETTVSQLAALLALTDMVATIDTGGMHVTRAVGTPMVLLGLAWERPLQWLALGREHIRILRGPDRDDKPDDYKLDEISVEWVTQELTDMTQRFPADPAAREARVRASLSTTDLLGR